MSRTTAKPATAERQPWHRRDGETETQHSEFLAWLFSASATGARRAPDIAGGKLAERMHWAERALAYDEAHSLPDGDEGKLKATTQLIIETVYLEARKMRDRAAGKLPAMSPRELIYFVAWLTRAEDLLRSIFGDDAPADLSQLSDEEFELVRKAQQLVKRVGGK